MFGLAPNILTHFDPLAQLMAANPDAETVPVLQNWQESGWLSEVQVLPKAS